MSNFEQRYMEWLDGRPGEKPAGASREPGEDPAAVEAAEWDRLRGLLRGAMQPAAMPHGEFLNHQVLAAIAREQPAAGAGRGAWRPLRRLVFAGAMLIFAAAVLGVFTLAEERAHAGGERFISQVIEARSADPKLGAYAFTAPGGKGTVLWIQDAGYIPANEKIK